MRDEQMQDFTPVPASRNQTELFRSVTALKQNVQAEIS